MPHVTIGGQKAFYSCPRPLAEGEVKGNVVVLVHGARGNHKIWAPQIEALAADHTPIGIDLPGHGESEGAGSTVVSEYRDFLKDIVDTLGLTRFVIAGHSMGGSIALDYALHYPGAEALILVGSAAKWTIPQYYIDLLRNDPEKAREESAKRNFAKNTPRSIIELNDRNNSSTDPMVGARDLEACNAFDVLADLDKIKLPTCIICGEEDTYVDGSRIMHSRISGSRVEWIKDAGHDPSIEQPEITNGIFKSFLSSLS